MSNFILQSTIPSFLKIHVYLILRSAACVESIKTYPGIPVDAVEALLKNIQFNEKMEGSMVK